jgi:nucleoside-diphosphate-sugar epimerase
MDATRRLADAALEAGVGRFVAVSTTLVYPGGLGRPATEDDQPAPPAAWGVYPATKAEADRALLALHRDRGLGVRIVRFAFVYGEGDPHLAESLQWAGRWPGHQRLQLLHHADAAQAVTRVLQAPASTGGSTTPPTSPRSPPWSCTPSTACPSPTARPAGPT